MRSVTLRKLAGSAEWCPGVWAGRRLPGTVDGGLALRQRTVADFPSTSSSTVPQREIVPGAALPRVANVDVLFVATPPNWPHGATLRAANPLGCKSSNAERTAAKQLLLRTGQGARARVYRWLRSLRRALGATDVLGALLLIGSETLRGVTGYQPKWRRGTATRRWPAHRAELQVATRYDSPASAPGDSQSSLVALRQVPTPDHGMHASFAIRHQPVKVGPAPA